MKLDWIDLVIRDCCEIPRDSPADMPEAIVVTPDELVNFIRNRMPVEVSEPGALNRLRLLIDADGMTVWQRVPIPEQMRDSALHSYIKVCEAIALECETLLEDKTP